MRVTGLMLTAVLGLVPPSGAQSPPPPAIDACQNQASPALCSFMSPQGMVTGNCYMTQGGLACVPSGAQQFSMSGERMGVGGPPQFGAGAHSGRNAPTAISSPPASVAPDVSVAPAASVTPAPSVAPAVNYAPRADSYGGGDSRSPGVLVESASKEEIQSAVSEALAKAMAKQVVPIDGKNEKAVSDVDRPTYQSSENPHNYALVVGVSKYSNVPNADFADSDARAVRKHLISMGYPERNIITLIDEKATMGTLAAKLESWLPKNVDEKSTVFVYFSGHGAPDVESKEAYLVPWDGDPESLPSTALPLSRLYGDLNKLKVRRVLVALDACFSGAGGRSVLPKGAKPLLNEVDTGMSALGKLVVFTASEARQISGTLEDQRHGTFTYYFLKGLNGAAYEPGREGHVTAGSLFTYLSPLVNAAAHRHSRDQRPQLLPSPEKTAGVELR
jgi:hypothetical protein